jgi:hypothetical protein
MAEAILVLPDLGAPFNTRICPASVIPTSHRKFSINTTGPKGKQLPVSA